MGSDVVLDFNRFLLFHPQRELTYIRKLSMSYGYYTGLAVVNRNDYVTHIGVDNDFHIVMARNLSEHDRGIMGSERFSKLESDDLLSVYRINEVLKLTNPFKLHKSCRGMRYTDSSETYHLKKRVLSTLNDGINIVKVNHGMEYDSMHDKNIILDLENIDFDLNHNPKGIILDSYTDDKAQGQTRLI